MKIQRLLAGMLLTLLTLQADGQRRSTDPVIVKAEVKPVKCDFIDCDDKDRHGVIILTYSDGKKRQVTTLPKSASQPRAIDPKISPDKRTVGWLEGDHLKTNTSYYFFGQTTLVIYGQGQVLTTLHGSLHYIDKWFFWNKGKQIALLSRGSHGPASDELYDLVTGKLVGSVYGPKLNKQSPEWARKLGN